MKNILAKIFNWYVKLSSGKKIIWGLMGIFLILPITFGLLLTLLMVLFIFLPFIGIITAIVLLVLSFIKKKNAREYRISSLISIIIAFVSVFAIDTFIGSDSETNEERDKGVIALEDESSKSDSISSTPQVEDKPDEVEEVVAPVINEGKIHFINTGNSDAILIENNGQFAMIDTGDTDDDAKVQSYLQQQGVKRLEYLVLTHYHADHIGGADTVITDFEVGTTLVPNGDADTQVYRDYINALSDKGLQPSVPLEGAKFELGSATLTFYNTVGGSSNENNNSLVVLYENGDDRALFTGDAEAEVESKLSVGDIDLLKVGHHGSKTSSTASFINQLQPEYAVILTGQPNQYGHPHEETLSLFESKGIPVYRSDEQGDIVFTSTGQGLETELSPGSYTPGQSNKESASTPQTQSESSGDESSSLNTANNSDSSQSNSSTNESSSSSSEGSSSSTSSSNSTTNYKDDNPNGIYNQESTAPKESYKNCTLLREVYPDGVAEGHPAYESKHDRDKDGWACER